MLLFWQRQTVRNLQLPRNQIGAGHHFSHRMLDLQPGVHFHEIKVLMLVHKKFNGPCTFIIHCQCCFYGGISHFLAKCFGHDW